MATETWRSKTPALDMIPGIFRTAVALGLLGHGLTGGAALAQQEDKLQQTMEASGNLAGTSIILIKRNLIEATKTDEEREKLLTEVAGALLPDDSGRLLGILPGLGGFVVALSPAEAGERVLLRSSAPVRGLKLPEVIEEAAPDPPVSLFDGAECGDPFQVPYTNTTMPWLAAVNAPLLNVSGRVWVIDSGITPYDEAASAGTPKMNIDHGGGAGADCTNKKITCQADAKDNKGRWKTRDRLGHGSMVAGLIGAADNGSGYRGVAPGVKLVPVKVFNKPSSSVATVSAGLDYVKKANPKSGDVIVMSWGFPADFSQGVNIAFEGQVKDLADLGVRIAVAAGNVDALSSASAAASGYVQTIEPARLGGYRHTSGGGVWTTSTVDGQGRFWGYMDQKSPPRFHPYSGYGGRGLFKDPNAATNYMANPDVAAPGVEIDSIWGKGAMNTCSGTSFSAAILAGLLVHGDPTAAGGGVSTGDPVSPYDPIAACKNASGASAGAVNACQH